MKRRLLSILLALTFVLSAFALVACGTGNGNPGGQTNNCANGHTFDTTYYFNNDGHFHKCSICGTAGDTAAHNLVDGRCTACEFYTCSDSHIFGEYTSDKNATCTADGTKTAKCENCDVTDTVTDAGTKLDHSYGDYVSDGNATCTADGTKTAKCENCDETKTVADEGSKLDHSYGDYVSDGNATCTADGTKTAKCAKCDATDTVADTGSKLDHSYGEYTSNGDATCTADGTKTAKCESCDATKTVADEGSKLAHNYVDGECTECGEADPDAPVDPEDPCKNGHTWGEYTSNGDATCTSDGTKSRVCSVCENKDTVADEGSKLDHSYGEYVSDGNATCMADGTKTAKCENCDETNTVVDAGSKLDHNYVGGECTECGKADPDAPVDPDAPAADEIVLTVDSLGVADKKYESKTADVSGVGFEFIQIGNYGNGIQMRDKDGNTSMLWNTEAFGKGIKEIKLVYSSTKDVTYANADAVIFNFGNEAKGADYTTKLSTTAGIKEYTITPDAETYTYLYIEHDLGYSMYWDSITIVLADEPEEPEIPDLPEIPDDPCKDGHTWGEYTSNGDATCKADGTKTAKCENCDETNTVADAGSKLAHNYVGGECTECGKADPDAPEVPVVPGESTTVKIVVADYAAENGWENSKAYEEIILDSFVKITLKATKGNYGNTGKYYTKNSTWRAYQSEASDITVTASDKTIISVKITYSVANTGILTLDGVNVKSDEVVSVNANLVTFGIGNTGTATNGNVQISAIEVVYGEEGEAPDAPTVPEDLCKDGHSWGEYVSNNDATCKADGTKTAECENCDETNTVVDAGSKLDHNYVDGKCTECGKADPDAPTVPGETEFKENAAYKLFLVHNTYGKTFYALASTQDGENKFINTTEVAADAPDFFVETSEGGYKLYTLINDTKTYVYAKATTYEDGKTSKYVGFSTTDATVWVWDELCVFKTTIDGADYGLGTYGEYSTISLSNWSYFTAESVGKTQFVVNLIPSNEVNTDTPSTPDNTDGGIVINGQTIPYYNGSTDYIIINNNKPFFSESDLKKEAFWSYSPLDHLGRTTGAFACICGATLPTDDRDDIGHLRPSGWVQANYSIVPGSALYNRSHLLAHSLMSDDVHIENMITGTQHMNQSTMQIFENQVLSAARSGDYIMYRVTPIYEGNNLVCTGVLMEAYSTNDNGDSIEFCVFLYNVQPGVVIDYTTGTSKLGDPTKANSSNTGASVTVGDGSTLPDAPVVPDEPSAPTSDEIVINVGSLGITAQKYESKTANVSGVGFEFIQIGNYGDGLQMRDKNGNTSMLWNTASFGKGIKEIKLVYSSTKDVTYANADAVIFNFGSEAKGADCTVKLSTEAGVKEYTITPDADTYTYFYLEHDLGYSMYWDSITIVLAD